MDGDPPHDRQLWLAEIAVLASRDEADRLTDDLITTICPDADHDGDCRTPWALTLIDGTSLSPKQQAELRQSIRLTNPDPGVARLAAGASGNPQTTITPVERLAVSVW